MTPDPAPAFTHLAAPQTPAARCRRAVACRSSAVVLDLEGQHEAAAELRAQADALELAAAPRSSRGDAA